MRVTLCKHFSIIKNACIVFTLFFLYNGFFFFNQDSVQETETDLGTLGKNGLNQRFKYLQNLQQAGGVAVRMPPHDFGHQSFYTPPKRLGTAVAKATACPYTLSKWKTWSPAAADTYICWSPSAPLRVTMSLAFPRPQKEASPWPKLNCIHNITARELRNFRVCPVCSAILTRSRTEGMNVVPSSTIDISSS